MMHVLVRSYGNAKRHKEVVAVYTDAEQAAKDAELAYYQGRKFRSVARKMRKTVWPTRPWEKYVDFEIEIERLLKPVREAMLPLDKNMPVSGYAKYHVEAADGPR